MPLGVMNPLCIRRGASGTLPSCRWTPTAARPTDTVVKVLESDALCRQRPLRGSIARDDRALLRVVRCAGHQGRVTISQAVAVDYVIRARYVGRLRRDERELVVVIRDKHAPGLCRSPRALSQVAGNRPFRNRDSQLDELSVNPGAPQRRFSAAIC